ncbi:MAG: TPM domain-containing protein [Pyrinomonadaceae bacterium]|nr:TPM domain-containing protein [Pyrinomonadaceae bacterium]
MVFRPGLFRKFLFALLAIAFATLVWLPGLNVQAQSATKSPIPLPEPFTPVADYANVIEPDTRRRLEAIYTNLKQRADIEFAVVIVPTTGERDIFEYSLDIARGWGIGSKEGEKNGFLLVVAVNDRKYFTQVSNHLEGDLTDGLVGQIQRERLVPQFRRGNYNQGIYDTIQAYIATLAEKRGFSIEGIDQSYAYRESREQQPRLEPTGVMSSSCFTLGVIVFVIIIILLSMRRGGGGGCLNMFLLGSLLNRGGRGGWGDSNSGWSGGGFGGTGGGGGFGGGFGGGGDFGGGGAGGSW